MELARFRNALVETVRMSDGAFAAVVADPRLRLVGAVLPAALIAPGTVATVVYAGVLLTFDRIDRTETVIRQVLIGTPVGIATWLLWALVIGLGLRLYWRCAVDRGAVLGAMGFAAWPLVILWFFWIPDWLQGAERSLGQTGVWIVAAASVLWLIYTLRAVREAVPSASERQVLLATTAGFLVASAFLMAVGNRWAIAPWISVFTRAHDIYIG